MISTVLIILKILGIILLVILSALIVLLLLALFVPVRYQIFIQRKTEDGRPVTAHVKVTWLLRLLNAAFSYPEAAYLKVRIACITVFRSDKPSKEKSGKDKAPAPDGEEQTKQAKKQRSPEPEAKQKPGPESEPVVRREEAKTPQKTNLLETEGEEKNKTESDDGQTEDARVKIIIKKVLEFISKLMDFFRNIRYTIIKIYDKIKDIVNNIQYYVNIIKSDTFSGAWKVCSAQALSLLGHILPGKIQGRLHIGTGDPASTGQVLAVFGILYPLLGNHIDIVPDFEQQIIEGELLLKGRITLFKGLKTAWIIYFNKDLRRLIKLFKREAA